MITRCFATALLALAIVLAGCGGSAPLPDPGTPGDPAAELVEVGPLLIRPASTAHFKAEPVPVVGGHCTFVALWGSQIDYLASQAMLDRIVFSSNRDGYFDVWVCDLDGSNLVQLTNNTAAEYLPQWSPDGTRIVFDREWPGNDREIMTMNANGAGVEALTDNDGLDTHPTWSPDGRRIAFETDRLGNQEIFCMFADGSHPTNLTNYAGADEDPDWCLNAVTNSILFASPRCGDYEILSMEHDGTNQTYVTGDPTDDDHNPTWCPDGFDVAWQRYSNGNSEVLVATSSGNNLRNFSNHPDEDQLPAWSSDGRWIAFRSNRAGNWDIWVQEATEPFHAFRVTTDAANDGWPHLGSPTAQTDRVLIGPAGADWGGLDPIWTSAYAGIAAHSDTGYLNFVRIGVPTAALGSLEITPLTHTAMISMDDPPVGVLVEAGRIVNLRQDAGRGCQPTVWDLDPLDPGAALLYFSSRTGKLASVVCVDETGYSSAAGARAAAVTERSDGDRLVLQGRFSAVFDASGNRIAGAASSVTIAADGVVAVGG